MPLVFRSLLFIILILGAFVALPVQAADSAKKGEGPVYVKMDPLLLPIIDDGHIAQHLTAIIVLELAKDVTEEKMETNIPRIKDAFLTELYGHLYADEVIENDLVNIPLLKEKLEKIIAEVVGDDKISHVLIEDVYQAVR